MVNAVFAERFGDGYMPLLAGREDGEGGSGSGGIGRRAAGRAAADDNRRGWEEGGAGRADRPAGGVAVWRQAEARMLAERVAELVHGGRAQAGDVVVLLRASATSRSTSGRCRIAACARSRPSAASGATSRSAICSPICARWPTRWTSRRSTRRSPRRWSGCSSDGLALLARAARSVGGGVWETALSGRGSEELARACRRATGDALVAFRARFERERRAAPRRTISQLIERAIDASGYREHVLGLDWGERRLANVHKLLRLARRFEASEGRDLRGFLDHVEYLQRGRQGRARRARRRGRAGRGAADEHPRRQGP